MRSPIWPLQVAIKERLQVMTSAPVLDGVSNNQAAPYQTIGEFDCELARSKTTNGMRVTHTVSGWSTYAGTKELADLTDSQVQALYDFKPDLSADGFSVVHVALDRVKIARYPDESGLRYSEVAFSYLIEDVL